MNLNAYIKMTYENRYNWTLGQNKPNSNPIKPNLVRRRRIENEPKSPLHKHCDLLHLKGCFIVRQLCRHWQTKWNYQINSLRKVVQKC